MALSTIVGYFVGELKAKIVWVLALRKTSNFQKLAYLIAPLKVLIF